MSLFDILRYPISNPPTAAEYCALPSAVLNQVHELNRKPEFDAYGPIAYQIVRYLILEHDDSDNNIAGQQ